MHTTLHILMTVGVLIVGFPSPETRAESIAFRVEKRIFQGAEETPLSEHLILFRDGLIYDLPQSSGRFVTVYEPDQKRVTLLDTQTKVQTSLGTEDLLKITASLRASATTAERREHLGLLAEVTTDGKTGRRTIGFGPFHYSCSTEAAPQPSMARHYGLFSILAARLNIATRDQGPPPFAAMTLSQAIAQNDQLPTETVLSVSLESGTEVYRQTLQVETQLDAKDAAAISQVEGMLAVYPDVPLTDFPKEQPPRS